jgi:hypothetical protein
MNMASVLNQPLRVSSASERHLEIENRPILQSAILAGVMLLFVAGGIGAIVDGAIGTGLIALGLMALFYRYALPQVVRLTQLRLDRSDGTIRLRVRGLHDRAEESLALADLARAEVRTRYGQSGGRAEPQVVLVLRDGTGLRRLPLDIYRADPEDALRIAGAINAWLGVSEQEGET